MMNAAPWPDIPQKMTDVLARNLDLAEDQVEIAYYGLQLVWTMFLNVLLTGLLAWAAGDLWQAVVGGLAGAVVRLFAGGAHSSSPWRCALVGAVMLTGFGRLALFLAAWATVTLPYFVAVGAMAVLVAVWRWAPVDSPAKPITNQRERRNLRGLALAAVIALGLVEGALAVRGGSLAGSLACAVSLSLLWQGFSLTRTAHVVLDGVDRLLTINLKRRGVF